MSILVTGASRLLGQAIAESFAGEGAIRVVGRNTEKRRVIYGSGCPLLPGIRRSPPPTGGPRRRRDGLSPDGEPVGGRWTKAQPAS